MAMHVFTAEEVQRGIERRRITATERTCKACGETKLIAEFRNSSNDIFHRCRPCRNARATASVKATGSYQATLEGYRTRAGKPKALWNNARNRAQRYGVPFDIEVGDVVVPDYCPLLGIELVMDNKSPLPNSPTLDCVIPALGYVKGNVWVISFRANTIKSDATVEELERVAANLRSALR